MRIGLISDTHGLLRPEAVAFLQGCDHIIHGGDIGAVSILDALRLIAPVTAVRGNNDKEPWAKAIPKNELIRLGAICLYAVHDIADLDIDPVAAAVDVVVSGHSHKPNIAKRDGVLYINPGSAGRRRFSLPISMAELSMEGSMITPRIVELAV